MPVVEGLACGSLVVASDIPVLREVGGAATVYCATGDVSQWSATVCRLLSEISSLSPTAQMSFADTADRPSSLPAMIFLGGGAADHRVPFQCSMSGWGMKWASV